MLLLNLLDQLSMTNVIPSKIFEYGASGRPIIAGASGYAQAFIEETRRRVVSRRLADEVVALAPSA